MWFLVLSTPTHLAVPGIGRCPHGGEALVSVASVPDHVDAIENHVVHTAIKVVLHRNSIQVKRQKASQVNLQQHALISFYCGSHTLISFYCGSHALISFYCGSHALISIYCISCLFQVDIIPDHILLRIFQISIT